MPLLREWAERQLAEGEAQARRERGGDRRKPPETEPCPLNRGNYSEARDPCVGHVRRERGTPKLLSYRSFKAYSQQLLGFNSELHR